MKYLIALLFIVGCSTNIEEHKDSNTISQIKELPQVNMVIKQTPDKPKVKVVENHVELDKQGMVDLINLYRDAKQTTDERNQMVLTLSKAIDERNQLLLAAKQEEQRANDLGKQLDKELKAHKDDNFWNSVELNVTRAVAIIAVASGL